MNLVIDATVAIKWFVAEQDSQAALKLCAPRFDCHAPDLLIAETTNLAWQKTMRGEIEAAQATQIAQHLWSYVQNLHEAARLNRRALEIALALRHPVYGCLYLACAELVQGAMVTADRRLIEVVQKTDFAPHVHHITALPGELLPA